MYDGPGKLYDETTGALIYEGDFVSNAYNGAGKSYDANTGIIIGDGMFINGKLKNK